MRRSRRHTASSGSEIWLVMEHCFKSTMIYSRDGLQRTRLRKFNNAVESKTFLGVANMPLRRRCRAHFYSLSRQAGLSWSDVACGRRDAATVESRSPADKLTTRMSSNTSAPKAPKTAPAIASRWLGGLYLGATNVSDGVIQPVGAPTMELVNVTLTEDEVEAETVWVDVALNKAEREMAGVVVARGVTVPVLECEVVEDAVGKVGVVIVLVTTYEGVLVVEE